MEFNAVDHLFPAWDAWTVFVREVQSLALRLDSMASTHPVRVEVDSPAEVTEIFDAISYAKGASIIRMLQGFLGHGAFMRGVQHYLRTFAYGNAVTNDLWRCIEEANNGREGPELAQYRRMQKAGHGQVGLCPVSLLHLARLGPVWLIRGFGLASKVPLSRRRGRWGLCGVGSFLSELLLPMVGRLLCVGGRIAMP